MNDELKTRPSGVDGIVVRDVPKGVGVAGGKYVLVHQPSGYLLSHRQFRRVGDAKLAAGDLDELGPWGLEPEALLPRRRDTELAVHRRWLEQKK